MLQKTGECSRPWRMNMTECVCVCPGIWLSSTWNNIMHRTFLHVTLSVRVHSSAGGRWLTLIKLQVTLRSESLPHIWRKTDIITRHLYTFPLAILFPHWYKNIPHLSSAQEKETERESCCLFSGPKLIANVKMDPSCSWSFAQAIWPTICGVCSQPHQTHVCGILELFGAFMNTQLHNYTRNKPRVMIVLRKIINIYIYIYIYIFFFF